MPFIENTQQSEHSHSKAVECIVKFNRYMPFEDVAVFVRQPDKSQDLYQVLFEDAYGNFNAEISSKEDIETKYKIEI